MDGVKQESNITDDPQDEWSVYLDIAEATDALVNGTQTSGLQFVRANGIAFSVKVQNVEGVSFLQFLWMISFGRYTRCITTTDAAMKGNMLPLNPLIISQKVANVFIKEMCLAEGRLCTRSELFPWLQGDIVISSEVWMKFVQLITV